MAGAFDAVLDEEQRTLSVEDRGVANPDAKSPFASVVDQEAEEQQRALGASLRQAVPTNPDTEARQATVSNITGIPRQVVERNEQAAETMARTQELQEILRSSPVLRRQMTDPEFARRAHDDVDNLRGFEILSIAQHADKAIAEHGRKFGQALQSAGHQIGQGSSWLGAAAMDVASKYLTGPLARFGILPEDPAARGAELFRRQAAGHKAAAEEARPKTDSWVERDIYGGVSQLPANVAALGLGLITRNPQMAMLPLAALTFGQEYGKADESDQSGAMGLEGRLGYAFSQGLVEYWTERAPALQILKDLKVGTPFYKMVAHNMIREGYGEQVATVLQDFNEWAALNPEKPFKEYLAERPSAAASTAIQTIVAVGGQTTLVKGLSIAADVVTQEQARIEQTEQEAITFDAITKLAQASKLAQRDPQSFAQYVQEVAEGGPLEEVWISGEQVANVMSQLPTQEWPESIREQLPEALDTGGSVRIPIGEYASKIARSDAGALLLPHLRGSVDSMSVTEAKVFMQSQADTFKQEAETILATEEAGAQVQLEAQQVFDHFSTQLNEVNRFTPQVNAGYAGLLRDFYVVTSQRAGMTPTQMLQQYPLTFTAQPVDATMDQGRGVTVTGVHYGNVPNLTELDAARFGEGARAAERRRIPSDGSPVSKRVNFYLAEGDDLPQSEDIVTAPNVYRAQLTNVYDFDADPDGILPAWRAKRAAGEFLQQGMHELTGLEQMVIDAGYSGYINRDGGTVTMLGKDKVPAQFLGDRATASMMTLEQGPAKVAVLAEAARVEKYLKPAERARLRANSAKTLLEYLKSLPPVEETAAVAEAGKAKRGWYQGSAEAMVNVFGPDAPRFAALLAALSPQTSVENNLTTALTTWKNWIAAGRPAERQKIMNVLAKSVMGKRAEKSVLNAWINNSLRALAAEDPGKVLLSGPKVNSFFLNLVGVTDEVTNDAWMANYAGVEQKIFRPMYRVSEVDQFGEIGGKGPGYMAMAVHVRQVAEELTQRTGEAWTPAEVQETVWSWAKTAYEMANAETSVLDLVFDAKITDDLIRATPDFRSLFYEPRNQKLLEAAGYGEQLRSLRASNAATRAQAQGAQGQATAPTGGPSDALIAAAVRLDNLRRARIEGRAPAQSVLEQGPSVGVTDPDVSRGDAIVNIGLATNDGTGITVEQALGALHKRGITATHYEVRQSDTEQTLVAQLSRALSPQEAEQVSRELNQEAIAQIDETGAGELYGPKADAWKPFNPEFFVMPDGNRLAQDDPYHPARGHIYFGENITNGATISLLKHADLSTVFHETGHFFLEVMSHMAAQPNPPAGIAADMATALKWFGVGSLQEWRAMHIEEKRPHHEKFARGFEAYLFEGKAPTPELQSLFSKFRAWLINVYQSIKNLNVTLNDDVRAVFDRMLGSENQIRAMSGMRSMAPLFSTQQEAMATTAEWEEYQALGERFSEDAVRGLETATLRELKWISNAKAGVVHRLQKEAAAKRKVIHDEIKAEVEMYPVYQAIRFLTKGEILQGDRNNRQRKTLETAGLQGSKLSLPALKEMYGTDANAIWRYFRTGKGSMVTHEGGLHPDNAAELLGFSSGDELVRSVLAAEPMDSVIQGLTDTRMLERHGELTNPDAIEREANRAINNEARAKMVAAELRFLSRIANTPQSRTAKGGNINVLARAAKQFAEGIIARKRINAIRPKQYASAEATAAKAALAATDPMMKGMQKRNQLVNLYATKAAENAVRELEKGVAYLKRVQDSKTIDPDYLDQIHSMLERFDLKASTTGAEIARRKALAQWVKEQEDLGHDPQIDKALLVEARRQHYTTLTMEEFRGLVDAIKNIEHLGRLKHKLLTAKDEREFREHLEEAVASVRDNAKGTVKERRSSERGPLVAAGSMFRGFLAEHRKFASLVREMDGMKDGGKLWELFSHGMNQAGGKEASMRAEATTKFAGILQPLLKAGTKLGKQTFTKEVNRSFTREERIGIALNMGNTVNRERVLTGEKWTPAKLNAVLDELTQSEWKFVQQVWDMLESYRPQIAEKVKRTTGVEPEWVEAEEVQTKFGSLRGGYYPIHYDPLLDSRVQANVENEVQSQITRGLFVNATTRRGHLKLREESTGRRLRYDFGNIVAKHLDQVIHDLSWHEYLIDANRLLRSKSLDSAIREHYGPEKLDQLKNALKDIAIGDLPARNSWERVINHLRHGATIVAMGFNVTVSLMQTTGLAQSMVRIGPQWVARGLGKWATTEKAIASIYEKSDMMRTRGKTLNREIGEIRNLVAGKSSAMQASYFYFIQAMQRIVDVPTWLGAYEKAMHQDGMTEEKAIGLADQAVLDSQGGGQIKDLAAIQRGGPLLKLWTNFYSYFNVTYNLAVERTKATNFKNPLDVARLAVDYITLAVLPSVLATLIKEAFKWDDDSDEEELAKKLVADQIGYLFGMMVGLREAGAVISGFYGYQGPAGARFFSEAGKLVQQIEQGEFDEAAVKAGVNTAGVLFHLPTGQVVRSVDGLMAYTDGKTDNPGALIVGSNKN